MQKRLIIIIAIFAAVGAFFFWRGHSDKDKAPKQATVGVKVALAEIRDVPLEIREVGNVVAYETVAVRSRLDSQVMEVKFKDGDKVKKGDLLFVLDDRTLKAQIGELEANVKRDHAQLENARQQYERAKTLTQKGFESEANLDTAKATYAALRASVGASEAALQSARVQLGYTHITSPITGKTGTINVTAGNTVKANDTQPLVTINQLQPIRVQTALSQIYIDAVHETMQKEKIAVTALREGSNDGVKGELEYLDNGVGLASGTVTARAVFANADESLWPGMFVTLVLHLGMENHATVVPEVAIQHGQSGDYVFVIKDGKANKRDVKITRIQDGFAVVLTGVQQGEQVVTDGVLSLKEGASVSIASEKKAPPAETAKQ